MTMMRYRSAEVRIIHGACPTGADAMADDWATVFGKEVDRFQAAWNTLGKAAGPIRNQQMIDVGRPELVVAFPGGRGTADMLRRARAANIPILEVLPQGAAL